MQDILPESSSLLRDLDATIRFGDFGDVFLDANDRVSWLEKFDEIILGPKCLKILTTRSEIR